MIPSDKYALVRAFWLRPSEPSKTAFCHKKM
jgi:hypothetical protein